MDGDFTAMSSSFNSTSPSTVLHSLQSGFDASCINQIKTKDLIEAVKILAKEDDIKVTLKYSLYTGAISGISSVIGGVVLTPFGLTALGVVIGAGIGSVSSFGLFKNKYVSLVEIIDQLPEDEKEKLAHHLREGLKNINVIEVVKFGILINSSDKRIFETLKFLIKTYHSEFFNVSALNGSKAVSFGKS